MTGWRAFLPALLVWVATPLAGPTPIAAPALAQEAPAAASRCDRPLCIGVRRHARPFAYRAEGEARTDTTSGPLSAEGYSGYMVRICDAVLQQMFLDGVLNGEADVGIRDVDSLLTGAGDAPPAGAGPRFDMLGTEFDILCDPATITSTRRSDFIVSPPLFLTGISVLEPPGLLPDNVCRDLRIGQAAALIGLVGGTTAEEAGVEALIRSGAVPNLNAELNNYLARREICGGRVKREQLVKTFATHPEAAAAYCAPPGSQDRVFYYLGDLEIIVENARAIPGCAPKRPTQTYTNDRYAIFAKSDWQADPERAALVAQFLETLARKVVFSPSLLDQAFQNTFYAERPSRKLEVFFWSIRGELRAPSADQGGAGPEVGD